MTRHVPGFLVVGCDQCFDLPDYFKTAVRNFSSGTFSTERRWPTMPTLMAPAALPMKPIWSMRPPARTSGAVTARKASPAPTVSTIVLVKRRDAQRRPELSVEGDAAVLTVRDHDLAAIEPRRQRILRDLHDVGILSVIASRASGASRQT